MPPYLIEPPFRVIAEDGLMGFPQSCELLFSRHRLLCFFQREANMHEQELEPRVSRAVRLR